MGKKFYRKLLYRKYIETVSILKNYLRTFCSHTREQTDCSNLENEQTYLYDAVLLHV